MRVVPSASPSANQCALCPLHSLQVKDLQQEVQRLQAELAQHEAELQQARQEVQAADAAERQARLALRDVKHKEASSCREVPVLTSVLCVCRRSPPAGS